MPASATATHTVKLPIHSAAKAAPSTLTRAACGANAE